MTDSRDLELSKLRKELRVLAKRLEQCQRNRQELGYVKDKLDHVLVRAAEAHQEIERKNRELFDLNKQLDALLESLLPKPIIEELRSQGRVRARVFESATVLFADFVGFADIAARLAPSDLVAALGHLFSKFDRITTGHGLEPLKTMGDSYRCLGGVLSNAAHPHHARDAVRAAMEMIAATDEEAEHLAPPEARWQLRVGIHTGPLVSGVVGQHKLTYDVWGETVNLASRFKEASEPGRVNVSRAVADACSGVFQFVSRGAVDVKNRGPLEMLFVQATLDAEQTAHPQDQASHQIEDQHRPLRDRHPDPPLPVGSRR